MYENVLNSNDIPAKLKIELLEYYRSKYMNTKHRSKDYRDNEDDDTNSESEDGDYKIKQTHTATKDGIRIALKGISPLHKKKSSEYSQYFEWFSQSFKV